MSEEKYKDILAEIESLPQGGITYKKINGKEYAYYQWREDGKQRSRRAKDDELETLMAQIERRKELEAVLKDAGVAYKTTKTAKPRKAAEKKPAEKKEPAKKPAAKKTAKAKAEPAASLEVESRWIDDETRSAKRHVLLPSGDESQAEELSRFLLEDPYFDGMTAAERAAMTAALTERIKARMLEDMLHLETKAANPDCEVFRMHLEEGAFDMVVADPKAGACQLYEIKHCNELSRAHADYLLDDEICDAVAARCGEITGKFVIYHGKTINVMEAGKKGTMQSVKYFNVEKYLEGLKK